MAQTPYSQHRFPGWLSTLFFALLMVSACQAGVEAPSPLPTDIKVAATPIQALIQTQAPGSTTTAPLPEVTVIEQQIEAASQATDLPPSPTVPPEPTSTSTPPPDPSFYVVQPGDTLFGIAEQFEITLDSLVLANGYTTLDEFALVIDSELQIPRCEAHQVLTGNTLAGIAQLCGVSLDQLVIANINRLAPLGSLDAVPIGFILYIPVESDEPEVVDCSTQPAREQVIEYVPGPGEGIFCLAQKFGVSTNSLLQGNIQRLAGGEDYGTKSLLIPPTDGAIYMITTDDVESDVGINELAVWYEVDPEAVTDWNGNPISDPLMEGQQLFIFEANLLAGPFQSSLAEEESE